MLLLVALLGDLRLQHISVMLQFDGASFQLRNEISRQG